MKLNIFIGNKTHYTTNELFIQKNKNYLIIKSQNTEGLH